MGFLVQGLSLQQVGEWQGEFLWLLPAYWSFTGYQRWPAKLMEYGRRIGWNYRLTLPLNFWGNVQVTVGSVWNILEDYSYPSFSHWGRWCHTSQASILRHSAFFTVQLSHPYMTTGKIIALTRWTFVGKVMSLLLNMLSRLVITFLPRSKRLLISWLQSPFAVILEPRKIKSDTVSTVSPSISHEVMGQMPWSSFSQCWALSQLFHSPLSLSSRGFWVPLHFLP